ncbi:phasin family protein [Amorphus coralli]|uniref:phasin family protein n=1 Tax=Amorphus coralli TaxID=340680 RepID=UPI00036E4F4D|nr:phasin family protein [Amorphus coralli]
MINGFEQIQKMNQDGFETAMKSFGTVQNGFQAIASEMADYSKRSIEEGSAALEKMMGAPSVDQAVETQMSFVKSSYEGMMQEMGKLGELYSGLAQDLYKVNGDIVAKATAK